ncbi:uncharacterized protein EI97DRAFT_444867 [Westerdykella ornata]|uniref:Uncharacterized protein n=1 Tax=Westerdykella ornata TaxID=318751 RepID=A0A6A6JBA9_WESOR|nr:uncharacterized protein EI97DRAFT_444867 [Westerdykella ornata]KAF2273575.1 hypothetical protein EI97DRAFT_444867 [Westerdykella ornata]
MIQTTLLRTAIIIGRVMTDDVRERKQDEQAGFGTGANGDGDGGSAVVPGEDEAWKGLACLVVLRRCSLTCIRGYRSAVEGTGLRARALNDPRWQGWEGPGSSPSRPARLRGKCTFRFVASCDATLKCDGCMHAAEGDVSLAARICWDEIPVASDAPEPGQQPVITCPYT